MEFGQNPGARRAFLWSPGGLVRALGDQKTPFQHSGRDFEAISGDRILDPQSGFLPPTDHLIPPTPVFWVCRHGIGLKMGARRVSGASRAHKSVPLDSGIKKRCRGALRSVSIII